MPYPLCVSNTKKIALSLLSASATLLFPLVSFAGPLKGAISNLSASGASGDLGGPASTKFLPTMIGNLISVILGIVGIIFVVLIIQSGIEYMTSAGAEDKVKEAKKRIVSSVIGIVILLSAYAVSSYIINTLLLATGDKAATVLVEPAAPTQGQTVTESTDPLNFFDDTGGSPGPGL